MGFSGVFFRALSGDWLGRFWVNIPVDTDGHSSFFLIIAALSKGYEHGVQDYPRQKLKNYRGEGGYFLPGPEDRSVVSLFNSSHRARHMRYLKHCGVLTP